MKRYVHERSTMDMLDAFQGKLDELTSCDQVAASEDLEYDLLNDEIEDLEPYYMLVDRKDVRDSDGFWTVYSMYRRMPFDEYVMVFGDPDIYRPEDGYFDEEFDNEAEAYEWFENYNGFEDDEVYDALLPD